MHTLTHQQPEQAHGEHTVPTFTLRSLSRQVSNGLSSVKRQWLRFASTTTRWDLCQMHVPTGWLWSWPHVCALTNTASGSDLKNRPVAPPASGRSICLLWFFHNMARQMAQLFYWVLVLVFYNGVHYCFIRGIVKRCTPSVRNYKSFQESWRVKLCQSLIKIMKKNIKIYNIK